MMIVLETFHSVEEIEKKHPKYELGPWSTHNGFTGCWVAVNGQQVGILQKHSPEADEVAPAYVLAQQISADALAKIRELKKFLTQEDRAQLWLDDRK